MTEAEWLETRNGDGNHLLAMLDVANERASNRQLRLFACACCRRFYHLLTTEQTRHALTTSEDAADGWAKFATLAAARKAIPVLTPKNAEQWASNCAHFIAARSAKQAALSGMSTSGEVVRALGQPYQSSHDYHADLLHEIIGNPFRSVPFNTVWTTVTVAAIAQAAYENRSLPSGELEADRLQVMADALEDAGCTDADLLAHLRSPGPHVRGCWALDLVLAKNAPRR